MLSPDQENLDLANVNLMLELLVQKKKQLEAVSSGLREIRLCFSHNALHRASILILIIFLLLVLVSKSIMMLI